MTLNDIKVAVLEVVNDYPMAPSHSCAVHSYPQNATHCLSASVSVWIASAHQRK